MSPKISEIFDCLQGFAIVSAIDLRQGYTQFPIFPGDTVKLTFTWNGVQYMFLGCPFGLKTLPAHFQCVMEEVLDKCSAFVFIFLDDIQVFSHVVEDHANHLNAVINVLNIGDCTLILTRASFATHVYVLLVTYWVRTNVLLTQISWHSFLICLFQPLAKRWNISLV